MPAINRNQCRVCLSPGYKAIFPTTTTTTTSSPNNPTELNCDRLAEKLRFVSMQSIIDSPVLPSMLCYGCIVQLNLAYNFKNIIIDTHIYLERHRIESGIAGIAPPTPSISNVAVGDEEDEDNQSLLSSISRQRPPQPVVQQPPPLSTVSVTATESSPESQVREEEGNEGTVMLDTSQIKQEVEDEATRIFRRVFDFTKTSSFQKELRSATTAQDKTSKRKSAPMGNQSHISPPHAKKANNNSRQPSPTKRPMVSVHRIVFDKNTEQDQQYLERILNTRAQDATTVLSHPETMARTFSNYDLNNSKMIRELFSNLPKSRLRKARRTST